MKKIFFTLIVVLLLTGCSFKYDLKITKNTINEIGKIENNDNGPCKGIFGADRKTSA